MKWVEEGIEKEKAIVLLHGGGLSWWNYREVARLLRDDYHVVLPILDGHGGSDADFVSIRENAVRLLCFLDERYGGHVFLLGGLSLGAQVAAEMLSLRGNLCDWAILESAAVIGDTLTASFIGPSVKASYGLIQREWFSRLQSSYLGIPKEYFADYFRDSKAITPTNMVSFLKASLMYEAGESLSSCQAKVRLVVGRREQGRILRSARLLQEKIPGSQVEVKEGLRHGEYSLCYPERYVEELLGL